MTIELLKTLNALGVSLSVRGDQLRFKPREAVTPSILAGIRNHKAELIAWHTERREAYSDAVERCNAAYCGTPIPFAELDNIAGRILNAATQAELAAAVAEYEATAIPDHITESLRQC